MKGWELEAYCVTSLSVSPSFSHSRSLSLSCGSSKQPSPGQLRGWCLTSQAENGPCPLLPCSISFPSCLSFVMDTACNKKSQHIYGVADLAGTRVFYLLGTKQLCYSLRIHSGREASFMSRLILQAGFCIHAFMGTWVCLERRNKKLLLLFISIFLSWNSDLPLTLRPTAGLMARFVVLCAVAVHSATFMSD